MPREEVHAPAVLVVGDVMNDVVVRPQGAIVSGADRRAAIQFVPGGSGANQAAWLAAEGVRTRFAGRVGAEDAARHADLLAAAGVEPHLAVDASVPTGTVVALISPDGERSFLTDRGANARLARGDLPDSLLDGVDLLHVSGYALFEAGPRAAALMLMQEARRRAIATSVDPGSHSFLREVGGPRFLEWTRGAGLCFPNRQEAAAMAGCDDPAEQLDRLAEVYGIVALKAGSGGALAAAGARRWSQAARRVGVANTSGAGDAFLAGFLGAYLRARPIEDCLHRAVDLGAFAATQLGARPVPPPPRRGGGADAGLTNLA